MTSKSSRKLSCPACGTRIVGKEMACPRCGEKLETRGKIECPSCGELISGRSKVCPKCKVKLSAISDKTKPQSKDKAKGELVSDLFELEASYVRREDERFSCPNCSQPLDGTESKCPKCGHALGGEPGLQCPICGMAIDRGRTQCPRCGVSLENVSREAEPITPFDFGPAGKPSRVVSAREPGPSRPCTFCGAIIPESLQKCPLCNTAFPETKPKVEAALLVAEPSKVEHPEESAIAPIKVEAQAMRPIKERKLKSAKVTAVPVAVPTVARGRINGVGRINGLGKVNGTGAVNGRAFVNGTGISNGLGARPAVGAAKRTSLLTKWQFLVVLVALIIVISTFVFLSYSNKASKFSIDGDFSDWEGATSFGTKIQSTVSTSNITEWAVAAQSSNLFLYFRTQGHVMSSPDAESFYLFIDSDGSNATGYVMESIGADYMLRLTGWDSVVNSTSLYQYSSSTDRYNWNAWTSISSLSYSLDLARLEARATMPVELGQAAKFVLVSKDSKDRGSVSYIAPLKGGVLIVQQAPSDDVAASGIIQKSVSAAILTLRFTCEGEGGQVTKVTPTVVGAQLASQEPAFSLADGDERKMTVTVDTSTAIDGQFVSAAVLSSGIASSFASVEIIGSGVSAYAASPPAGIAVDGAFADWAGRLSIDQDSIPVTNPNVDIDEVGNLSTSQKSFFYVSVEGEICSGTFVPAMVTKPAGGGGGGAVIPRHTAEDILSIYVDSDKTNTTGALVAIDSKQIGADQKIEVKGLFGQITSSKEFDYSSSSGDWVESNDLIYAAKDSKRIEIEVSATSLGGSADIDYIVETTSWKGRGDLAMFDPSSVRALTRTWVVDPATTSDSATSLSSQRKIFYDGTNYWSFYFDGADTVYKYSSDSGITWSSPTRAFATSGVNKVSVWYDSAGSTVYAVGDVKVATRAVSVQRGVVDPTMRTITWSPTDSTLAVSLIDQGNKNTFISKDAKGYLWILSSNNTGNVPRGHDLSTFRSASIDSVTSWTYMGNLIGAGNNLPNCNGNILPAGTGGDMFAIYSYSGNVASRKFTTSWSTENIIHAMGVGNPGNTDNAPASAVVDSKRVVHVVYGTSRKSGTISAPTIEYSHNLTDQTAFTPGLDLDPSLPSKAGDYYPTISLETSAGNLYVLWLQSDNTFVPRAVIGRMCVSGIWSEMTIQDQTIFTKQYLTSAYAVSDKSLLCWQWTQNTTAPIQVLFDSFLIPEFSDLALPMIGFMVVFAVYGQRSRSRDKLTG